MFQTLFDQEFSIVGTAPMMCRFRLRLTHSCKQDNDLGYFSDGT
jgi:hypothetical protein